MAKIGRNDACPCGSGKKYKKCCMSADAAKRRAEQAEWDALAAAEAAQFLESDVDDYAGAPPPTYGLSCFSELPPKIPAANAATEALVDAWWKRFMPVYRKRDAGAMLSLIRELIDEHPEAVNHSGLDQEAMVELPSIFMAAEKADELTALLLEIRQGFPLLYDQTCGYTDPPLVALLLRQGRQDLIPSLLDRFLAYGADCGYIKLFQEILIAGNCGAAIMVLGEKMKTFWPEWGPVFAAFDRHDSSAESADMVSLHMQSSLFAETLGVAELEETLSVMFGPVEPSLFAPEILDNRALALIFSRYMMWLHEDRGMSWPSAMAFAHGACHCYHFSLDAARRDFWALSSEQLSSYVKGRFTRQWDSDAVATCTLYQSLYWLADFWQASGQEVDVRQDTLQAACVKRVEGLLHRVPNYDEAKMIFANFPEYPY